VADVMANGDEIPCVTPNSPLIDALDEITRKGLGMTTVVSDDQTLLGVFTDGDLRRAVEHQIDLTTTQLEAVMTTGAQTVTEDVLAAEAVGLMERHKISALVVVDEALIVRGVVTLLALLKAGIS